MAAPSELSLEEIRQYLLQNGGSAKNHDLVKHFKAFLTHPETRVEARNRFKEYVNILATIKNEEGEKYLVLKKKYRQMSLDVTPPSLSFLTTRSPSLASPDLISATSPLREPPPYRPPPPATSSPGLSPSLSPLTSPIKLIPVVQPVVSPPPSVSQFRITPNSHHVPTTIYFQEKSFRDNECQDEVEHVSSPRVHREQIDVSPPVPPRRKSQDKLRLENKENANSDQAENEAHVKMQEDDVSTANLVASAEQLSVRERMQRFNRLANETDSSPRSPANNTQTKKRSEKTQGAEEDDRSSVVSQLDGKSREWLVRAAQGDYQALAKLAAEEPRLTRLKDPCSGTALHWAAKHGNEDIVKLLAGTYRNSIKSVNETTNGGYTPLHIAMQFGHENIFNLLVQVYGANQELRDYSGKKPRQYLISQEAEISEDAFIKIKARKKHAEKDLGFLRIGSLNVRVKRTTEAFSQFLGVTSHPNNSEKIHKNWGSADNIKENGSMPPPKYGPIKKRKSRRAQDFGSSKSSLAWSSQPGTPESPRGKISSLRHTFTNKRPSSTLAAIPSASTQNDSDSDTNCGFDTAWRGSAQL